MEKVTGIGGVFFKSNDATALGNWYRDHLGIDIDPAWIGTQFGDTVWSISPAGSSHFERPFMINYRVRDLDAMLAQLRAAGAAVADKIDDQPYGRFGWATDPDGNRIELWEPK